MSLGSFSALVAFLSSLVLGKQLRLTTLVTSTCVCVCPVASSGVGCQCRIPAAALGRDGLVCNVEKVAEGDSLSTLGGCQKRGLEESLISVAFIPPENLR